MARTTRRKTRARDWVRRLIMVFPRCIATPLHEDTTRIAAYLFRGGDPIHRLAPVCRQWRASDLRCGTIALESFIFHAVDPRNSWSVRRYAVCRLPRLYYR